MCLHKRINLIDVYNIIINSIEDNMFTKNTQFNRRCVYPKNQFNRYVYKRTNPIDMLTKESIQQIYLQKNQFNRYVCKRLNSIEDMFPNDSIQQIVNIT